ncbi:starch-binding protein, partial [Clostridium bornimense]|uniref:triple tyrosine motif-containing protein n=1 Tax=Clostridium bornimense TaxID=1216932 RepID=UPI001C107AFF|nr:starch-binding protein [Clostridium bornimense]
MGKLSKRLTSIVTTVVLTCSLICADIKINPQVNVQAATNDYGLASNTRDGVILHAWNWSFNTIKENLPKIAEAGYTSIQTSPIQGTKENTMTTAHWWLLYQPTNFKIGNAQLGSRDEFKSMCEEAEKYGIKIIVDVVCNHMANTGENQNKFSPAIEDKYKAREFWHEYDNPQGIDYNNRYSIIHDCMDLPDLNTSNKTLQNDIISFLNDAIDCGADGFRFDAAKHIELPDDNPGGSDFWPTILGSLKNKDKLFIYGEILDTNNGNSRTSAYSNYINVNSDSYSKELRKGIGFDDKRDVAKNIGQASSSYYNTDNVDSKKLVTYVETHDDYAANGSGASSNTGLMSDWYNKMGWAIVAARDSGTPLYYNRPAGSSASNPLPGTMGKAGNDMWKSADVVAVNKFHNAMIGQKEYLRTLSNNTMVIERGNKGAVIVNLDGTAKINTETNLKEGTYKSIASDGGTFYVSGGRLTGELASGTIAVIGDLEEPVTTPTPTITPASGTTFTDSLTVTLGYKNATSGTYSVDDVDKGSFKNGDKIKIGEDTSVGSTVKVTLTVTDGKTSKSETYTYKKVKVGEKVTASIIKPSGWSNVYAYVYDESVTPTKEVEKWPGTKMTDMGNDKYTIEIPKGWSSAKVIFNNGGSNQIPDGVGTPGFDISNTSMIYKDGKWQIDETDTPIDSLNVKATPDKATFTTNTYEITLGVENATSATYSVDGGKKKSFKNGDKIKIGQGKVENSKITVDLEATDDKDTVKKTYTYTKNAPSTGGGSIGGGSIEGAIGGKYGTNLTGYGKNKTITIDGDFSDWSEDMLVAQGVANDDPRSFRGTHEGPVYDDYALYSAWDNDNLYLMWQYTNVTDVIDPVQGYPIGGDGKPYNGDIPQVIALDLGTGYYGDGTCKSMKPDGTYTTGPIWNLKVKYETSVDTLLCFSSKPGVGEPCLFKTDSDGMFNYSTGIGFKKAGISFKYGDGFLPSKLIGIKANGYEGYVPDDLYTDSSNWIDFLETNHNTKQDTMYEMVIPLNALGITKDYIENNGIGVMHLSTFGESTIGCNPHDKSMLDVATEPYVTERANDPSTSLEKADWDNITVPLARIGKAAGTTPPTQQNLSVYTFGADRCSPQVENTTLNLSASGQGGTAPYTYKFEINGKMLQDFSSKSTCKWTPTEVGDYVMKVTIKDADGKTVTREVDYEIESSGDVSELKASLLASPSDSQTLGKSTTFTAKAIGGKAPYKYKFTIDGNVVESDENKCVWTASKEGTYDIKVVITDADGNTANSTINNYKIEKQIVGKLSIDSFSVNPKSAKVGETIKLSANASGGNGTIQYKFVAKKGNNETIIKDYSTTKTVTWTPSVAGEYELLVYAKDSEGNSDSATTSCTVEESSEEVVITTDKASPQVTGTAIKITAKAKNINGAKYMFSIFSYEDGWEIVQKYSTSNEYVWIPKKSGKYKIEVAVMDSNGNEIENRINYNIAAKITRIEENNSNIKYAGKWSTVQNSKHSGGAVKVGKTAGSSAEFKFTGTGIKLLASTYKDRGIAKITLDGESYSVDMYSASAKYKNVVFQKNNLKAGTHSIKIEYTGMR